MSRNYPCPQCGKPALLAPANPHRPFCSERCRLIDLGAWASESYQVPGEPPADEAALEDLAEALMQEEPRH